MVDTRARRELALLTRRFLAGRIDNHAFDDRGENLGLNSEDVAVFTIFYNIWHLYDDFKTQKVGKEIILDKTARRIMTRWILFLQGDYEFEWSDEPLRRRWQRFFAARCRWVSPPEPFSQGDEDFWPFFRRADFECALKKPKLLHGTL